MGNFAEVLKYFVGGIQILLEIIRILVGDEAVLKNIPQRATENSLRYIYALHLFDFGYITSV